MINFGVGKLIATLTHDSTGAAVATPTPVILGTMQDVGLDMSVEMKELYGSRRYPIAVGQGKGKIEIKAKYAEINGDIVGQLFFGKQASAGIKAAVLDFAATIPATPGPYTLAISPPSSGTFLADLGVVNTTTGVQFTRVASAPAAGQYSLSGATYTFAAADQGKAIAVSYEYSASSGGSVFPLTNDVMGVTPFFTVLLQNSYGGQNLVVKLNRCVSGKLSVPLKNDDFALYDFEASAFADPAGSLGYICLF